MSSTGLVSSTQDGLETGLGTDELHDHNVACLDELGRREHRVLVRGGGGFHLGRVTGTRSALVVDQRETRSFGSRLLVRHGQRTDPQTIGGVTSTR